MRSSGREILYSVLVANECLHSRIRSGEPCALCKLDLEKTNDHVNEGLLLYMLTRCSFGEKWRLDSSMYFYGVFLHFD